MRVSCSLFEQTCEVPTIGAISISKALYLLVGKTVLLRNLEEAYDLRGRSHIGVLHPRDLDSAAVGAVCGSRWSLGWTLLRAIVQEYASDRSNSLPFAL